LCSRALRKFVYKDRYIIITESGALFLHPESSMIGCWVLVDLIHPPPNPLSNRTIHLSSLFHIFERGKENERGRSPLSHKLPSPAINICGYPLMFQAGKGAGER
jgi:hypothetical protein